MERLPVGCWASVLVGSTQPKNRQDSVLFELIEEQCEVVVEVLVGSAQEMTVTRGVPVLPGSTVEMLTALARLLTSLDVLHYWITHPGLILVLRVFQHLAKMTPRTAVVVAALVGKLPTHLVMIAASPVGLLLARGLTHPGLTA